MSETESLAVRLKQFNVHNDDGWLSVPCRCIQSVICMLKLKYCFAQLTDMSAIDTADGNFYVTYVLRNIETNSITLIKSKCDGSIKTITNIFQNAYLYECEIYEMFGISFIGHADIHNIFTHSGEHVLRKKHE